MAPVEPTISRSVDNTGQTSGHVPRPHLFLTLDCERPTAPPLRVALVNLDEVRIGRGRARELSRVSENGIRALVVELDDFRVSTTHAVFVRELGRWVVRDRDSKNGVFVNGVRCSEAHLADGDLIEMGHTFFTYRSALPCLPEHSTIVDPAKQGAAAPVLSTLNTLLELEFDSLMHVAASDTSVVVLGETGTGKELVSRAIHELSRRSGPFVAVNCGALPHNLVESTLFGHRRGSFSGATEDRVGLVRSADGGTLLLDEIGDLPAPAQVAMLRVLQEREVTAVGAASPVPVDFRLVSATHRDLTQQVAEGELREDLFARISGFTVRLPPLRDRREDMGLIIGGLLTRAADTHAAGARFTCEAARAMLTYSWPRNIRQLGTCLQAALAQAQGERVALQHLPPEVRQIADPADSEASAARAASASHPELKSQLVDLLVRHRGNVSAVARDLGTTRAQVHRWAKRFGIAFEDFR